MNRIKSILAFLLLLVITGFFVLFPEYIFEKNKSYALGSKETISYKSFDTALSSEQFAQIVASGKLSKNSLVYSSASAESAYPEINENVSNLIKSAFGGNALVSDYFSNLSDWRVSECNEHAFFLLNEENGRYMAFNLMYIRFYKSFEEFWIAFEEKTQTVIEFNYRIYSSEIYNENSHKVLQELPAVFCDYFDNTLRSKDCYLEFAELDEFNNSYFKAGLCVYLDDEIIS